MNAVLLGFSIALAIIFNVGYLYAIFGNIFLRSPRHQYKHENWMANLNGQTRLKDIVFPGSHDSLIFEPIEFKQKYEDIEPATQTFQIVSFVPGINHKVNRWTQTQNSNLLSQLKSGIRAFDFRLAQKEGVCYGFHTFLGPRLKPSLEAINTFLDRHPQEIILISFRTKSDLCKRMLYDELGDRIWVSPLAGTLNTLTLNDLWGQQKNIILSDWDTERLIVSDWLNSYDEEEKAEYIKTRLKRRHEKEGEGAEIFYNLEWTVTPQMKQVLFNYDSLLYKSYQWNQKLPRFLKTLSDELKAQINIISIDNTASFDLYRLIEETFPLRGGP